MLRPYPSEGERVLRSVVNAASVRTGQRGLSRYGRARRRLS